MCFTVKIEKKTSKMYIQDLNMTKAWVADLLCAAVKAGIYLPDTTLTLEGLRVTGLKTD